jgi:hypothetical protein
LIRALNLYQFFEKLQRRSLINLIFQTPLSGPCRRFPVTTPNALYCSEIKECAASNLAGGGAIAGIVTEIFLDVKLRESYSITSAFGIAVIAMAFL